MPNVQTIKKRLDFGVLHTLFTTIDQAVKLGVERVDCTFFCYCLLLSQQERLHPLFGKDSVKSLREFILDNTPRRKKTTTDQFNVSVDRGVAEILMRAERDPEQIKLMHVLYSLVKNDRKLATMARGHGISTHSILSNMSERNPVKLDPMPTPSKETTQKKSAKKDAVSFSVDLTEMATKGVAVSSFLP